MLKGSARIGTSGWIYKHWRNRFYPQELKQADWFDYYASHFDTVEINYSFYRIPSASAVEAWSRRAPEGFLFALKLWRGITHYRKLKNTGEYLRNYFEVVNRLPVEHRGPLLVQLPPSQGKDLEKLDDFLNKLSRAMGKPLWQVAVEFRHDSWLEDLGETFALLSRHGAAVCLHDMGGRAPAAEPNDAPFVYMRRHGSGAVYGGGYSLGEVYRDAENVKRWTREGRDVFVYYNNDMEGHAIVNARQLRESVKMRAAA